MSLTGFLLARIAEDEAVARAATPAPWAYRHDNFSDSGLGGSGETQGILHASWEQSDQTPLDLAHIARHDPARVLAECEAKRRIVELHTPLDGEECCPSCGDLAVYCKTLPALAAVYADHADYRDEWKP